MQTIVALSHSAVIIRHWFEIDLDDASMEHGVRIELRELAAQPHRGSESAAQVISADRPLWRADLFDRLADEAGRFGAAHYHPAFSGNEPCERVWDPVLTADPWGWLGDQLTSPAAVPATAVRQLDPEDAEQLRDLAAAVVAQARQVSPECCSSSAECFRLTRDARQAVQMMIGFLREPALLDTDWVAPWRAAL